MVKILFDLINYVKFKKREKNFKRGIFIENKFILKYLSKYTKNAVIISFEKLNLNEEDRKNLFVFKTDLFRQLIFLTLKLKFLYCSTPGLNTTFFVKSKLSKCKYIYLQHSPVGLIKKYQKDAFKYFDILQIINNFQKKDILELNSNYKKKIKTFKSKYALFNTKIYYTNKNLKILIAPTWNTDFYESNYHVKLYNLLNKNKYEFIFRPHPMSLKKKEITLNQLSELGYKVDLNQELDFKNCGILISDWSGIFIEYSYFTNRKSYLIDTKQKKTNHVNLNSNYVSIEEYSRNKIAYSFNPEQIDLMILNIFDKINNPKVLEDEKSIIQDYFNDYFY